MTLAEVVALRLRSALTRARQPVPAASTAVFRIGFGLLVAFAAVRVLAKGWVETLYLQPEHHLTYPGFGWVEPLPGPLMHLHFVLLAGLGLSIALGYRHRRAAVLFVVGLTYVELVDASLYLNHYWYVTLAGVLLAVLPVNRCWSLDARAGRVRAASTVPAGVVWLLRAQLGVVYLFAGVAKLNPDWLFEALPLRLWLADRTDLLLVGSLLDEPLVAYAASWAGAVFDLTIVAWLLWRRTRPYAYAAVVAFHVATWALFPIGVFPWVMIVGTLVFFPPDWPHRVAQRVGWTIDRPDASRIEPPPLRRSVMALIAVLAMAQLLLPLRHFAYPGDVRWTEEGYYLAWRVMLTEKAGYLDYRVTDPTSGQTWIVGPEIVLTDWQITQAAIRPDLVQATAHLIADHYRENGTAGVEVRADAFVSMNGRKAARLIDPDPDLAAIPRTVWHKEWILSDR